MKHRASILFFILGLGFFTAPLKAAGESMVFSKNDRVLIVAPHPDDEALGTAGVIQTAIKAGAEVKILYLTHGDQNEIASLFYQKKPLLVQSDFVKSGLIRKREAINAMSVLGLGQDRLIFLGYPDFGTLTIWRRYWGSKVRPFRNFFTRMHKVAYEDDFSYGNYFTGDFIVNDFEKVLGSFRPTQVFTTCPFDLNSDHRAAYLYLNAALLGMEGEFAAPKVYLYLIHTHRWPESRHYNPQEPLEAPKRAAWSRESQWISLGVDPEMEMTKKKAILEYKSQIAYSKDFMLSFARSNELFFQLPPETLPSRTITGSAAKHANETFAENQAEYSVTDHRLWADLTLSKPLEEIGAVSLEIFGLKKGASFAAMPKLQLMFYEDRLSVKSGNHSIRGLDIPYEAKGKHVQVGVPISLLNEPDYVFVSTHAGGDQFLSNISFWKILRVPKPVSSGHPNGDKL